MVDALAAKKAETFDRKKVKDYDICPMPQYDKVSPKKASFAYQG